MKHDIPFVAIKVVAVVEWGPNGNIAYHAAILALLPTHKDQHNHEKITRKTETSKHYKLRCITLKSTATCSSET